MEKLIDFIQSTNGILLITLLLVAFSKFALGINYISFRNICFNYLDAFRNPNKKLLIVPIIIYFGIPFLLGLAAVKVKIVDDQTINIITIIVSILTAMLFTFLTTIIDMKAKIKNDSTYFSSEANISNQSLVETYHTVMFEILVSVLLLIMCFINIFTKEYGLIQSFIIYYLTFVFVINLFMILKRIYKVIDTDMKK